MNKIYLFSILACFLIFDSYAQKFTIEDIEIGRLGELAPDNLENIQWRPHTKNIVYSKNDTLYDYNINKNVEKRILTLSDINSLLTAYNQTVNTLPSIKFYNENSLYFQIENLVFSFDLIKSELTNLFSLPKKFNNLELNNTLSHAAFTLDSNVYVIDSNGKQLRITADSADGITNGQIVYRHEFGTTKGIYWSPKGNYFAFYHNDETQVTEYPLVNITSRVAEVQNTRYPMAGMMNESTEIWVYSVSEDTIVILYTDTAYDYHTNISWTQDESSIYVQHLNRAQNKMMIKSYSVATGKMRRTYFTEDDEEYVEPLFPLDFASNDPSEFYYISMRDGNTHLYRYKSGRDKPVQLTVGSWEITEFVGADPGSENLYFIANEKSPLERHLYKFNTKKKSLERITKEAGTHSIRMSSDGNYFIDIVSSFSIPRRISVLDAGGNTKALLLDAPNPVTDYKLANVEIGIIKAADDTTDIYYKLVTPADFDTTRQYPVIIYLYGGPHVQLITNSWMDRIDYLQQYLAQQGYISFTIDPRGSDNRGADFEQVIHRQTGIPQLEDQMKGIEFLKSKHFVDTTRIGVHGWSYGGYMTILMMLNYPEIFKVGVAGGPVTSWELYEIMYGERYMDTPDENPAGYELTNLSSHSHKLKGKLLIIHGAMDPVVVWQHSLAFLQSCIENNVQPDYFVYPMHGHNVTGTDRVHLTRMITGYFFEHL